MRANRTEYMQDYFKTRYAEDEGYRQRTQERNRNAYRKKPRCQSCGGTKARLIGEKHLCAKCVN